MSSDCGGDRTVREEEVTLVFYLLSKDVKERKKEQERKEPSTERTAVTQHFSFQHPASPTASTLQRPVSPSRHECREVFPTYVSLAFSVILLWIMPRQVALLRGYPGVGALRPAEFRGPGPPVTEVSLTFPRILPREIARGESLEPSSHPQKAYPAPRREDSLA